MTGGTGIGLFSLSKRIEALLGSYGVGERLDGLPGTVFWFSFPYRPDHTVDDLIEASTGCADELIRAPVVGNTRYVEASATTSLRSGLRILVVDDSISILSIITRFLTMNGHSVTTCENGAIGLDILKNAYDEQLFDLVLTDIQVKLLSHFIFFF
jgi:hypothetical protein